MKFTWSTNVVHRRVKSVREHFVFVFVATWQVCLIKMLIMSSGVSRTGYNRKICRFNTQHKATEVSACLTIRMSTRAVTWSFHHHESSPTSFGWPRVTTPAQSRHIPAGSSKTSHSDFWITAQTCHKQSQWGSSERVMLAFDGVWHFWRIVLFTDESWFASYQADGVVWAWWRRSCDIGFLKPTQVHILDFRCTELPWWDPHHHVTRKSASSLPRHVTRWVHVWCSQAATSTSLHEGDVSPCTKRTQQILTKHLLQRYSGLTVCLIVSQIKTQ